MNGIVERLIHHKGSYGAYFFIMGEDGQRYFGRKTEVTNSHNHKRYCYVGNSVTFDPGEPMKEGLDKVASNIWFENVSKERRNTFK